MTQKTKTIKKTAATTAAVDTATAIDDAAIAKANQTNEDAKNALLIVSLTVNAFVLIGWVTLQVTSIYDYQVAAFLFTR